MAGDWIKMRVWIASDPQTLAMADYLAGEQAFVDWLTNAASDGCDDPCNDGVTRNVTRVTRNVTARVTVSGLLLVWGIANDRGKRDEDDLILSPCFLNHLDEMSGIPCFGDAMNYVGWAFEEGSEKEIPAVRFPKFLLHNVPAEDRQRSTNAERQRRHREKTKKTSGDNSQENNLDSNVTRNVTVTPQRREENSRVKKSKDTHIKRAPYETRFEAFWQAFPKVRRQGKEAAAAAYKRAVTRLHLHPDPHAYLLERLALFAESDTAKSKYCWGPTPWLNQGHYDDDPAAWARDDPEDKPFDVADLHLDED